MPLCCSRISLCRQIFYAGVCDCPRSDAWLSQATGRGVQGNRAIKELGGRVQVLGLMVHERNSLEMFTLSMRPEIEAVLSGPQLGRESIGAESDFGLTACHHHIGDLRFCFAQCGFREYN